MVRGPERLSSIAPERPLDFPQDLQEAFRRDVRFELHDAVQEPIRLPGFAPSLTGSVS